jgi:hypothetical protein
LQRPSDRQVHAVGERNDGPSSRVAVLYESGAVLFPLPHDRSAFAEALSEESPARSPLAGPSFEEREADDELA